MELLTQRAELLEHYKVVREIARGSAKKNMFAQGVRVHMQHMGATREEMGSKQYTAGGIGVTCYKLRMEGYEELYVASWSGGGLAIGSVTVACNTQKGYVKWRDTLMKHWVIA